MAALKYYKQRLPFNLEKKRKLNKCENSKYNENQRSNNSALEYNIHFSMYYGIYQSVVILPFLYHGTFFERKVIIKNKKKH